jgi:hypothetical protein
VTRRVVRRALALMAAAALMTGCATQTGDPGLAVAEPTNAAPAPADTLTPAGGTTPDAPVEPDESEEPSVTARPATLKRRLLPASRLPGFNAQFTWKTTSTLAAEGTQLSGTCHKFAMTSIGASKVVRREYAPVTQSRSIAGALVAEFPESRPPSGRMPCSGRGATSARARWTLRSETSPPFSWIGLSAAGTY